MRRKGLIISLLVLLNMVIISLIVVFLNQPRSVQISSVDKKAYDALVEKINTTTSFDTESPYFTITSTTTLLDNGNYLNRIFLTNPRIAMYKIQAVVVEHGVVNPQNEAYRQSFGVIGGKSYQMIPGQMDLEFGYVSDIELELVSLTPNTTYDLYIYFENELGDFKMEQIIQQTIILAPSN